MHGTKIEYYGAILRDLARTVIFGSFAVASVGVAAFIVKVV